MRKDEPQVLNFDGMETTFDLPEKKGQQFWRI